MNNTHSIIANDSRADCQAAFNMFDNNGDGMITSDKLHSFLMKCNYDISMNDVSEIIRKVDKKGNGKIDFDDFMKAANEYNVNANETNEQEVINVFRLFDKEGTGMISHAQMKVILNLFGETLTTEEIDEMIMEADVDGDGFINYEEFVRMMMIQ